MNIDKDLIELVVGLIVVVVPVVIQYLRTRAWGKRHEKALELVADGVGYMKKVSPGGAAAFISRMNLHEANNSPKIMDVIKSIRDRVDPKQPKGD